MWGELPAHIHHPSISGRRKTMQVIFIIPRDFVNGTPISFFFSFFRPALFSLGLALLGLAGHGGTKLEHSISQMQGAPRSP